ncbi:hypothetical protein [Halalkalibacter sp. APA_J-10(15)]|nr:hypothetical protein [Halalkalibacter sp. APA_J-10(15)]
MLRLDGTSFRYFLYTDFIPVITDPRSAIWPFALRFARLLAY